MSLALAFKDALGALAGSPPSPRRGEGRGERVETAPRGVRRYLRRASAAIRRNSAATSALLPAGAPSRPGVQ